jgi:transposase
MSWDTWGMQLTDEHWGLLAPLLTPPPKQTKRGRPRRDDRSLLEGILWVLRTGAQWDKLPREVYPPKSTCFARFQEWNERNVFPAVLGRLYELLEDSELIVVLDGSEAITQLRDGVAFGKDDVNEVSRSRRNFYQRICMQAHAAFSLTWEFANKV